MPNDELQPNYEFIYAGGEQNAYFFSTNNDIAYQVKFVPSNYLFAAHAELQIQVKDNRLVPENSMRGFIHIVTPIWLS